MDKKHLIIGMGQIGQAIFAVLKDHHEIYVYDIIYQEIPEENMDVLHICIPYSEDFMNIVNDYIGKYKPELTIIYSTVPIGTCEKLGPHIVHSPVEGKHPALEESVRIMPRWLGAHRGSAREAAKEVWEACGVGCKEVGSSITTEYLKLMSTAIYGINLVFADYMHQVAESIALPWDVVKEFNQDYNELYQKLGMEQFQKFVLDPPEGEIGGHCIVPNAKLLNKQFPSELLDKIILMEKKE